MSVDNIEKTNIIRYSRKAKRHFSGFADTKQGVMNDMLSNFIEHCYKNIDELNDVKDNLIKINYKLNK